MSALAELRKTLANAKGWFVTGTPSSQYVVDRLEIAQGLVDRIEAERDALLAIRDAAEGFDHVFNDQIGFMDPPDGSVGSCLDAEDSLALDAAHELVRGALAAYRHMTEEER